jgi:hypothetical protein
MSYEINGNVYILTNPSMPGLVKIGFTDDDTVNYRITDLWTTGVPEPFKLEAYAKSNKARELEKQIHNILSDYRLRKDREFFKISVDSVLKILHENFPNITWITDEAYELIKKDYWLDTYNKNVDELIIEVDEFEKYAKTKSWYAKTNNKWYLDDSMNEHNFRVLKKRINVLKEGIEKRPEAVAQKSIYLKSDDKWARHELIDIRNSFQEFKTNI